MVSLLFLVKLSVFVIVVDDSVNFRVDVWTILSLDGLGVYETNLLSAVQQEICFDICYSNQLTYWPLCLLACQWLSGCVLYTPTM